MLNLSPKRWIPPMVLLPILLLWLRSPMAFPPRVRWALMAALSLAFVGIQQPAPSVAQSPIDANRLSDESRLVATGRIASTQEGTSFASRAPATVKSREGTQVESVRGRIVEIGRRWALVTDEGDQTYRILENLALERIARAVRSEPTDDHWSVSGTLTEFSGQNYLLLGVVTRASSDRASGAPTDDD